jgi:RNA polymerase subunit RPABC4/transcription elongation factor Spt4
LATQTTRKRPVKHNRCKMCGTYVRRGVQRCPECGEEILDEHGVGMFLVQRGERSLGALIGILLGIVPTLFVTLILNDPHVLDWGLAATECRTLALLTLLVGAGVGWFWKEIMGFVRKHDIGF